MDYTYPGISPEGVERLIHAILLRDDTPGTAKIANKIYNDITMGNGAFVVLCRDIESEITALISKRLPVSIIGKPSAPVEELPKDLNPAVEDEVVSQFKEYLNTKKGSDAISNIYTELCDSIERAGWSYGLRHLPEALEMVRDKVRKQAAVYRRSADMAANLTNLQPLYEAAVRISPMERVRSRNFLDVQTFFVALCENIRSRCGEMSSIFAWEILSDLADWPRFQEIIDTNAKLLETCLEVDSQFAEKPKYRFFSDPDRSSRVDLLDL